MKTRSFRRFLVLAPLLVAAFLGLFTSIVYALWNGVLADVVPVKAITFWQALGLLVLAKILFGGFPCGRRGGPLGWRGRRKVIEHWESLSPEEREKMREEMRRRGGGWPCPPCCDPGDELPSSPAKPEGGQPYP